MNELPLFAYTQSPAASAYLAKRKPLWVTATLVIATVLFWLSFLNYVFADSFDWRLIWTIAWTLIGAYILILIFGNHLPPPAQHFFYRDRAGIFVRRRRRGWHHPIQAKHVSEVSVESFAFEDVHFYAVTFYFGRKPYSIFSDMGPHTFGIEGTADLQNLLDWCRQRNIEVRKSDR